MTDKITIKLDTKQIKRVMGALEYQRVTSVDSDDVELIQRVIRNSVLLSEGNK